jgi:hypothetical protein
MIEKPRLQRQNQAKRQGKDFEAGIDGGRASQKVVRATSYIGGESKLRLDG